MAQRNDAQDTLQLVVSQNADYRFRDFFTVVADTEKVVLEFGNVNRGVSNQVVVGDRIVMSIANTVRLRDVLQRTLDELQKRVEAASRPAQAGVGKRSS